MSARTQPSPTALQTVALLYRLVLPVLSPSGDVLVKLPVRALPGEDHGKAGHQEEKDKSDLHHGDWHSQPR